MVLVPHAAPWHKTLSKWPASRLTLRFSVRLHVLRNSRIVAAQLHILSAAVVTEVTEGTLTAPVSGLMGMAFSNIASSGATPFWEALADSQGTLDEPLMAFQLTRFIGVEGAKETEPGGTFNLGAVNTSLFTGDIDYQSIPEGQEGFWIQELAGTWASK